MTARRLKAHGYHTIIDETLNPHVPSALRTAFEPLGITVVTTAEGSTRRETAELILDSMATCVVLSPASVAEHRRLEEVTFAHHLEQVPSSPLSFPHRDATPIAALIELRTPGTVPDRGDPTGGVHRGPGCGAPHAAPADAVDPARQRQASFMVQGEECHAPFEPGRSSCSS